MPALSARLEAILQLLQPCRVLADVCTDHGLVPIAAVQRGVAAHAIAADLRAAPLLLARRNVDGAGLSGQVTVVQADGLRPLEGRSIDAVVMAGVSGELMVRLCREAPGVLEGVGQLVLQPNSDAAAVRAWARSNSWHLRDELMIEAHAGGGHGRFFTVCAFKRAGGPDPAYALGGWSGDALCKAGPLLLARRDPVASRWYQAQRARVTGLLEAGGGALQVEQALWQAACDFVR